MKLITNAKLINGAVVALVAATSTGALADTIVMQGNTNIPALTFTPMGSALEISTSGFHGTAIYGMVDSGTVDFGAMDFTTDPLMSGPPGPELLPDHVAGGDGVSSNIKRALTWITRTLPGQTFPTR